MKEIGTRINNMVKVLKYGQMVQNMRVNTNTERSTEKELSIGVISHSILVNFITIIYKVREFIHGLMEGNLMASGNSIRWMVLVYSLGVMEENILVIM